MAENTFQPIPEVNMGATEMLYSDRHPYTILEVSKETVEYTAEVKHRDGSIETMTRRYPKWIKATEDHAKLIDGSMMSESQTYEYTTNQNLENAATYIFHKASGLYRRESKKWVKDPSITIEIAREKNLHHFGGYYIGSKRTNQEQTAIILGFKEKYYDPSF
jgi:hypothetical protein